MSVFVSRARVGVLVRWGLGRAWFKTSGDRSSAVHAAVGVRSATTAVSTRTASDMTDGSLHVITNRTTVSDARTPNSVTDGPIRSEPRAAWPWSSPVEGDSGAPARSGWPMIFAHTLAELHDAGSCVHLRCSRGGTRLGVGLREMGQQHMGAAAGCRAHLHMLPRIPSPTCSHANLLRRRSWADGLHPCGTGYIHAVGPCGVGNRTSYSRVAWSWDRTVEMTDTM